MGPNFDRRSPPENKKRARDFSRVKEMPSDSPEDGWRCK